MKLRDLQVGKRFMTECGRTYIKLSNNGDITIYNECRRLDNLNPDQRRGLMLIGPEHTYRLDKEADVTPI